MNILNSRAAMIGVGVAVAGLVVYLLAKKVAGAAGDAARAVGAAIDPTADTNLAYRGVNHVGTAVTGNKDWSLGVAIYDLLHGNFDPNAPSKLNILEANSDADGRPSILR